MAKHRVGIIGAGMYGKVIGKALLADGRAEIAWTCSAGADTAGSAAAELGAARWTTDYRELLRDETVEAVAIATPPWLHEEQLAAALAAGKHVLLEKPMSTGAASARRMAEAARARPELLVLEASCRHTRLGPKFAIAKAAIDSGRIGEVYHIHHVCLTRRTFIEWNPRGAWAMRRATAGGGPLFDMGVYDLSFHLGLLGDSRELLARKGMAVRGIRDVSALAPGADVEQHAAAWMEFSGGLSYYYERGSGTHFDETNESRIHGSKGSIRLSWTGWDKPEVEIYSAAGEREIVVAEPSPGDDLLMARHFIDCLEGGTKPAISLEAAARHIAILEGLAEEVRDLAG